MALLDLRGLGPEDYAALHHRGALGWKSLFRVRDRNGRASVPVRYVGAVPDPFRNGREVIVTVRKRGSVFVGEKDSLVTKCPSKFTDKPASQT